ncbi:DUF2339 domain-containing protein [Paenibacillus sp. HN-1]|uniref:DUF2339 domain-containing protein n=1 Tax=Paenibacillus TaxID=44249 RepID=UPI001CA82746|nr:MULTISPECIES: DUF2339 domain-containing protein [Paenibacillus]MBY9080808.1 DUF2339 domain-containing protein [Paenibacillus sp. CGMCC 1.18879]MBY9085200.1 DUF2339 domain-containing protein [Paenibacillus sinensis]
MKELKDRLRSLKNRQDMLMKEYQTLISELSSDDLMLENEHIKRRLGELEQTLASLQAESDKLKSENRDLREALTEQMMNEKLRIVRVSSEKLHTYFGAQSKAYQDRLTVFEDMTKISVNRMHRTMSRYLEEEKTEISDRLDQLKGEIEERIERSRKLYEEESNKLLGEMDGKLNALAAEPVSEETIRRRREQNRIEMKIGQGWINRLGILLIILGVGAAFKYSYSNWFTGYMKSAAFFLLGALMLAGGEWLFRKGKGTFALGLLGGGISVLYGSVFYSYFLLEVIGLYTGLVLSVLITLTGVLLSIRYQSRTICSLALVGGYLPVYSYIGAFGLEGSAVYAAMGYLFLLNLSILLISLRKRWIIVNYISFAFNTPSMLLLIYLSDNSFASMLYAAVTFAMYLTITLAYPFKHRARLSWWDFSLLGVNTLVSCITMYMLFIDSGLGDYKGALALLFCLMYFGLGRMLEKLMPREKHSMVLFYSVALTFAVLMIPFQLGQVWWSMGWLIEGIALIVFAGRQQIKNLERAGWGLLLLCLGSFFGLNVPLQLFPGYGDDLFNLKYTFITAGMLAVAWIYGLRYRGKDYLIHTGSAEVRLTFCFKYVAVLNFWAYLLYESVQLTNLALPQNDVHYRFYQMMLSAVFTFGIAYVLPRLPLFYDSILRVFTLFLHGIGSAIGLGIMIGIPALRPDLSENGAADYIALALLVIVNVLIILNGRNLLKSEIQRRYASLEFYPVALAVYMLVIVTAFLSVQLHLNNGGLSFSIIYLLLALLYIIYGFRFRFVYIRRFGLGLTLLATGKLLLYDLSLLTSGSKIIAYFSFGVCLLGISYIYQKVSDKLGDHHGENVSVQKD